MKPIAGKGQYPYNNDGFCISGAKLNGVTHEGGFNIHQQRSDCVFDLIERSTGKVVQYVQMVAHDQYAQPLQISIPTSTLVTTIPDNSFFVKTVRTDGGTDSFVTAFQYNLIKLLSGERIYHPWPLIQCSGGDDIEDYSFHVEPALHGWVGDEFNIKVLSKISLKEIEGTFTYDGNKVTVLELLKYALKLKRLAGGYHNLTFTPNDGRRSISLDITNYVDKADSLVAVLFEDEATHGFQVYGSRHLKKEVPFYVQIVSEPEWFVPREPIYPDSYNESNTYSGYPIVTGMSEDKKIYSLEIPKRDTDGPRDSSYIGYTELRNWLVDINSEADKDKNLVNAGFSGTMIHSEADSYLRFPDYSIEVVWDNNNTENGKFLTGPVRLGETLCLRASNLQGFNDVYYSPTSPSRSLWRWKSSDPSVASIDNYGRVTTHKEGTTKIDFYFEGYPELNYIPGYDGNAIQYLTVKADAPLSLEWEPSNPEIKVVPDTSAEFGTAINLVSLPDREPMFLPYPTIRNSAYTNYDFDNNIVWFTGKSTIGDPATVSFSDELYSVFPIDFSYSMVYNAEYEQKLTPQISQYSLPHTIPVFGFGIDVIPIDCEFCLPLNKTVDLDYEIIDPDNILIVYESPYYETDSLSERIMFRPIKPGKFQLRIDYPDHNKHFLYNLTVLPVPKF